VWAIRLWVTIPFDPQSSGAQPETTGARVRCLPANEEKNCRLECGQHFEQVAPAQTRGMAVFEGQSQNGAGNKISLPIRVRPLRVPCMKMR